MKRSGSQSKVLRNFTGVVRRRPDGGVDIVGRGTKANPTRKKAGKKRPKRKNAAKKRKPAKRKNTARRRTRR